ncbi:CDGSH iron-sulfur domain-containing protein [Streptomyces sp. NPDC050560]|uniref:CDGSH iron-sulfur domain-containing protein n=1 Tax=Streptomyces sp. NPDC050560 TaxID=3365630 RepID=UPI0037AFEE90
MPNAPDREPRRIAFEPGGPMLVEGPVEIALDDGATARSDRFVVAVCRCGRSGIYPWCDTSHRRRPRRTAAPTDGAGGGRG